MIANGPKQKELWEELRKALADPEETARFSVLRIIAEFVHAHYGLGLNPLPKLQKLFPDFIWQFHHERKEGTWDDEAWHRLVDQTIPNCDYFWPLILHRDIITAKRKNCSGDPWKIYAIQDQNSEARESYGLRGAKLL